MEYTSNISVIVNQINSKVKMLNDTSKLMREIATTLLGDNKIRVFTDGLNTKEQIIGKYSTVPMLVGASSFKNITSANKYFSKVKSDNKASKKKGGSNTGWVTIKKKYRLHELRGGYAQLRKIDWSPNFDTVNLKRTGKMQLELTMAPKGKDFVIGFPANYNSKLNYKEMIKGFENKYGGTAIWGVSPSEQKTVEAIIDRYVKNIFK